MVQTVEYYYPSADKIHNIFVRNWLPENKIKGIVQISHGVAEHSGRYDDFARFLAKKGFFVTANDHLGHGKSIKDESELCFFAEQDGWDTVVRDMEKLRQQTSDKYPDIPYFMLGHSMGSFLLRTYLIKYPGKISAAVLSGTGQIPPFLIKAGSLIAQREAKKKGKKAQSPLIQKLSFGNYNNNFKPAATEFDWLSSDKAAVDKYIADPLCGAPFTVGLFLDMMQGMKFIGDKNNLAKMDKKTPVLFVAGDHDPVGNNGKQVQALYEAFIAAGCQDTQIRLFAGARHEILNETVKDEVYATIYDFLKKYL